jgi:hypothetical protein
MKNFTVIVQAEIYADDSFIVSAPDEKSAKEIAIGIAKREALVWSAYVVHTEEIE